MGVDLRGPQSGSFKAILERVWSAASALCHIGKEGDTQTLQGTQMKPRKRPLGLRLGGSILNLKTHTSELAIRMLPQPKRSGDRKQIVLIPAGTGPAEELARAQQFQVPYLSSLSPPPRGGGQRVSSQIQDRAGIAPAQLTTEPKWSPGCEDMQKEHLRPG